MFYELRSKGARDLFLVPREDVVDVDGRGNVLYHYI